MVDKNLSGSLAKFKAICAFLFPSLMSFVKELLEKAAQAGVENKFTFSMSATMNVVVKYKKKLIGRVYLHGKKNKMVFKVDGKTLAEDGLTLSDCKKLLIIWVGQIKESAA